MKYPQITKQNFFNLNLGFMDRQVRLVLGMAMILTVLLNPTEMTGAWNLLLLAAIPIVASAIVGWDPLYAIAGKSYYVPQEEDIHQRSWAYSNMGIIDRTFRLAIGALIIVDVLLMGNVPGQNVLALLAIPLIATAIIAWDPIYALFKLNSFAARVDAQIAEAGASEQSLAKYYEFPQATKAMENSAYSKAA